MLFLFFRERKSHAKYFFWNKEKLWNLQIKRQSKFWNQGRKYFYLYLLKKYIQALRNSFAESHGSRIMNFRIILKIDLFLFSKTRINLCRFSQKSFRTKVFAVLRSFHFHAVASLNSFSEIAFYGFQFDEIEWHSETQSLNKFKTVS